MAMVDTTTVMICADRDPIIRTAYMRFTNPRARPSDGFNGSANADPTAAPAKSDAGIRRFPKSDEASPL